jgi:hypothetical protein
MVIENADMGKWLLMVPKNAAHNDMCKWLLIVLKNAAHNDMCKWLLKMIMRDDGP